MKAILNPIPSFGRELSGAEAPQLQTAFFDIEVDFDSERGYPQKIPNATAITVYPDWVEQLVTLAMSSLV